MNRVALVMCGLLSIVGLLLVATGLLVEALMRVVARMVWKLGHAIDSPSDYQVDLCRFYKLAIFTAGVGFVGALALYRSERRAGTKPTT
jgi:hypothetical protein